MVHQLSLVGSVPSTQYEITVQTLQLLSGMNPIDTQQHYVSLKPRFPFKPEFILGKLNQIDQYRVKLISSYTGEKKSFSSAELKDKWCLQILDIPNAGKRSTCQQNIYETLIVDTGAHDDLNGFLEELGYIVDYEYWSRGVRFYYNNIIVEMYQISVLEANLTDEWLIKCFVNVAKSTDVESINQAVKWLESFAKEVQGLFELVIPDRLTMDSRIQSS